MGYWIDPKSTANYIEGTLVADYERISEDAMKIANTLKNYVCVDKKWADDSAIVFAKWWNEENKNLKGNLYYDSKEKKLKMKESSKYYDGEDCIKFIVNMAAAAVYGATCVELHTLNSAGYTDTIKKQTLLKNLSALGADSQTLRKKFRKANSNLADLGGDAWNNFMETKLSARPKWEHTKITVLSKSATTQKGAVTNLVKSLNNYLDRMFVDVKELKNDIRTFANNKNEKKWMGFDQEDRAMINATLSQLIDETEKQIEIFASNLKVALKACGKDAETALEKLRTNY